MKKILFSALPPGAKFKFNGHTFIKIICTIGFPKANAKHIPDEYLAYFPDSRLVEIFVTEEEEIEV